MEPAGLTAAGRARPRERRLGARGRRRRDDGGASATPSSSTRRTAAGSACRAGAGIDMHCERHQFTGLTRDGGFADYVLVDERSLIPLPAGRRAGGGRAARRRRASPPTTRSRSSSRASCPGTTAAVIGVGGVGHIALQLLKVLGGGSVIAIDTDERRRRLARELGADEVLGEQDDVADAVREATNGAGADVVLDFVGTDETHAAGLRDARAARPLLGRRLRRDDHGPVGRARRRRDARSRATSSAAGSTSGSCSSSTRAATSRCARRRIRSRT